MYLCTRREIWTSFSCLVLLKCYHVVFSQFKIPANLAQLAVPKMLCLYANAVVQPSVQHYPCYMAWKTKVHTWCRHCHLCINAPMWREKRWLQGLFDPPSYINLDVKGHCWCKVQHWSVWLVITNCFKSIKCFVMFFKWLPLWTEGWSAPQGSNQNLYMFCVLAPSQNY